uniref:Uncharacterized protein n=1 Tax=Arundo donax TaxID=35708 RepID=A0A0A9GAK6_ARUDO
MAAPMRGPTQKIHCKSEEDNIIRPRQVERMVELS